MHINRRHFLGTAVAVGASTLEADKSFARDIPTVRAKAAGFDSDRLKRIPLALRRRVDAGEAPGFLAAIMRDSKLVSFDAVGFRDIAAKTPMSRDTIFRIMSMTKPIVSVAAMMLVEENRLRLSDPVAALIPAFAKAQIYVSGEGDAMVLAPAKRQVQIRNLLMHTAGYSYGVGAHPLAKLYAARKVGTSSFASLSEFCQAAAALPLMFEPGNQWQYGISTDILGHVVELASGQSLPDFLRTRVFEPLGMVDTAFHVAADKVRRFANCYTRKPEGLVVSDAAAASRFLKPPSAPSGGGGLTSTADDYLQFVAMLSSQGEHNGVRLLGPETVRMMRANHLPKAYMATRDPGFGLGFGVDMEPSSRNYYGGAGTFHWSGANCTHFWVDPTNRIAGLLMTQMEPFNNLFEDDIRALTYQAFLG